MLVLREAGIILLGSALLFSTELPQIVGKRFSSEMRFNFVSSIATDSSGVLYVVDRGNSRIVVLSPEGKFLRQIGGAGQGQEDLMYPLGVALDENKTVAILDSGNQRVQFFSSEGRWIGQFRCVPPEARAYSLAIGGRDAILLNQPTSGKLVSVYSRKGGILKAFGSLLHSSEGYPGKPSDRFPEHLLNIADLFPDRDGAVWVVFQFMPIVQHFSSKGHLDWRVRLSGSGASAMEKSFWNEPGASKARSGLGVDGFSLPYFVSAATVTSHGNLALLLGNNTLIALDRAGHQIEEARYRPAENSASVAALGEHDGILFFGQFQSLFRSETNVSF